MAPDQAQNRQALWTVAVLVGVLIAVYLLCGCTVHLHYHQHPAPPTDVFEVQDEEPNGMVFGP